MDLVRAARAKLRGERLLRPEDDEDVKAVLDRVILELVAEGRDPEHIHVFYRGVHWRWSPMLRSWDIDDPKLAAQVREAIATAAK